MTEVTEPEQSVKRRRFENSKGVQCFAINCATYRNKLSKECGITFHKFPDKDKKKDQYLTWVRNCRRDVEPTSHARLCSKHFESTCFYRTLERCFLKEDAIPTIFQLPDNPPRINKRKKETGRLRKVYKPLDTHDAPSSADSIPKAPSPGQVCISELTPLFSSQKSKKRQTATSRKALEPIESLAATSNDTPDVPSTDAQNAPITTDRLCTEHSYISSNLEERVKTLEEENRRLKKRLRNAIVREKRVKKTCKKLADELQEKTLRNSELESRLASYNEVPCDLFRKPSKEYTADQRAFASTLYLYSKKSYEYLRTTMGISLPNPKTLKRWTEKKEGAPELEVPILEGLEIEMEQNPDDCTQFESALEGAQCILLETTNSDAIPHTVVVSQNEDGF